MDGLPKWSATTRPLPPQRRRAVIIGAGPTGMCTAFHLGEHSLLLEQRDSLEDSVVHADQFPLDVAEVSGVQRKALFITCSSRVENDADEHRLIHVARWQPPEFISNVDRREVCGSLSVRSLVPLLRGELRLGARVVRISPSMRLIELADGDRFVFDKLISTLSLALMAGLVTHELPCHVRHDESLRYWLSEHDVEVADRATQDYYGDLDEFAAGKRVAEQVGEALMARFRNARLFVPRLVQKASTPAKS